MRNAVTPQRLSYWLETAFFALKKEIIQTLNSIPCASGSEVL